VALTCLTAAAGLLEPPSNLLSPRCMEQDYSRMAAMTNSDGRASFFMFCLQVAALCYSRYINPGILPD
jgi:hypothetical protein